MSDAPANQEFDREKYLQPEPGDTPYQIAYKSYYLGLEQDDPPEVVHKNGQEFVRLHLQSIVDKGNLTSKRAAELLRESKNELAPNEILPSDFEMRYLSQDVNADDRQLFGAHVVFKNGYWWTERENGADRMTREEILEYFGPQRTIAYFSRKLWHGLKNLFSRNGQAEPVFQENLVPEEQTPSVQMAEDLEPVEAAA